MKERKKERKERKIYICLSKGKVHPRKGHEGPGGGG